MDEINIIKNKNLQIINFLIEKTPGEDHNINIFLEIKKTILKVYEKNDVKGLKSILKDLNELIQGLEEEFQKELENISKDKSNVPLMEINKIIDSGKIRNEVEYQLLFNFVEENYLDNSENKKINLINKLLLDWECR